MTDKRQFLELQQIIQKQKAEIKGLVEVNRKENQANIVWRDRYTKMDHDLGQRLETALVRTKALDDRVKALEKGALNYAKHCNHSTVDQWNDLKEYFGMEQKPKIGV